MDHNDLTPGPPAKPPVTCMCLTYGRPHLLEEAIESFLRQDYLGDKELIILNDCEYHRLHFVHPEVHIINISKRFRTIGAKRNACAALASHDILFVWDDDDISLSHRLSYAIAQLENNRQFFKSVWALKLDREEIGGPVRNLFHGSSCFSRTLFDQAKGYPCMGSGQDLELERIFQRILGRAYYCPLVPKEQTYFIYRWRATGSFHLSAFGRDGAGKVLGQDRAREYVKRQIANGEVPRGDIILQSTWRKDYESIAHLYLTAPKSQ